MSSKTIFLSTVLTVFALLCSFAQATSAPRVTKAVVTSASSVKCVYHKFSKSYCTPNNFHATYTVFTSGKTDRVHLYAPYYEFSKNLTFVGGTKWVGKDKALGNCVKKRGFKVNISDLLSATAQYHTSNGKPLDGKAVHFNKKFVTIR